MFTHQKIYLLYLDFNFFFEILSLVTKADLGRKHVTALEYTFLIVINFCSLYPTNFVAPLYNFNNKISKQTNLTRFKFDIHTIYTVTFVIQLFFKYILCKCYLRSTLLKRLFNQA